MNSRLDSLVWKFREARVTNIIIVVTSIFFLFQNIPGLGEVLTSTLALKPESVMGFEVWRLLTYGLVHGSIFHLLFNMVALYMLGIPLEYSMGKRNYLIFYIVATLFAGIFSLLALLYSYPVTIIGASGAITAIFILFALNNRDATVLLFFIIPMPIYIAAIILVVVSIYGSIFSFGGVSHITHLGGIVIGSLYWYKIEEIQFLIDDIKEKLDRKEKKSGRVYDFDSNYQSKLSEDEKVELELDIVLKKISKYGMNSLSPKDKKILERASGKRLH